MYTYIYIYIVTCACFRLFVFMLFNCCYRLVVCLCVIVACFVCFLRCGERFGKRDEPTPWRLDFVLLRPISGCHRVLLKHNLNYNLWNSQAHREFPRYFESANLSRDNLSSEIGRRLKQCMYVCMYIYIYIYVYVYVYVYM